MISFRRLALLAALCVAPITASGAPTLEDARALRVAGHPQAALHALQDLRRRDPQHVGYRFEEAVVYAELGNCGRAISAMRDVAKDAPYQNVRTSIDAALAALCPKRPTRWERSASARVILDGNYNNATSATSVFLGPLQFTLDEDARAQKRYGLDISGHVGRQIGLNNRYALVPYLDAGATLLNASEDSRMRFSPGVALDRIGTRSQWRIGPVLRTEFGDDGYIGHVAAIDGYGQYVITPRNALDWNATLGYAKYKNTLEDGKRHRAEIGWTHLLDNTSHVRFSMSHTIIERTPQFRAERQTQAQVIYANRISAAYSLEAFATIARLKGDAVHPFFQERRDDTITTIGIASSLHRWETAWGTPVIGLSHTRARSPIPLHDYSKNALFFNFTKSF